jgi:hypothetical protein
MYLQDDYLVYRDPNATPLRVIRGVGAPPEVSGLQAGEICIYELSDGSRQLVWVDGGGTPRDVTNAFIDSITTSEPEASLWIDGASSALSWVAGGNGRQVLGDKNEAAGISGLTLTSENNGVKVDFTADVKRFLPQTFRLFRSDANSVQLVDRGPIAGPPYVDANVTDGDTYRYRVDSETTLLSGNVISATTQTKDITYDDPNQAIQPPQDAPANVSVDFGGLASGPWPVEVSWTNASSWDVEVDIDVRDGFSGSWQSLNAGLVTPPTSLYSTDPTRYTKSQLKTQIRGRVRHTNSAGDGPWAEDIATNPGGIA